MLYVNGKYVDPNGNDVHSREYKELRKRLLSDEFKFPIVLKTRKTAFINPTGYVEPPQNVSLPCVTNVETENGTEEWRYTTGHPRMVNGTLQFPISRLFINETTILTKDQVDLAIYLIFKARPGVSDGFLVLEDERKEADEYAKNRAKLSAISFMLYDEDSPLSEYDVRMIALAFGISGADSDKYTVNQVKRMLEEAVVNGEVKGDAYINYKRFKEFTRVGEHVRQLARIQMLYDRKRLEYDSKDGTFYLLGPEGERLDSIYRISIIDYSRKDMLLLKKLKEDEKLRLLIKEETGIDVTGDTHSHEYKELMETDMNTIRQIAKKEGVDSYGRKKEDIVSDIISKRQLERNKM